jgi:flagellar protein FliL
MAETAKKAASAGGKGRGKLVIVLAGAAVLLLGGGRAAAYFLGLFGGGAAAHGTAEHASAPSGKEGAAKGKAESGKAGEGGPAEDVTFVELPDMLVNLQAETSRPRYLRLRIAVEVEDDKAAAAVKALTPRVLDSFQMFLRSLTVDDVQGSAGMERLKEEMLARVNVAVEPSRIRDVLFKEILVQ